MNLPFYRRRNWRMTWRTYRPLVLFALFGAVVFLIAFLTLRYLEEHTALLSAELAHRSLILDVQRLSHFGAEGYTRTDWTEGTTSVQISLDKLPRHAYIKPMR